MAIDSPDDTILLLLQRVRPAMAIQLLVLKGSFTELSEAKPILVVRRSMASAEDFRRIALAFPGAEEGAHMGHADFRVGGEIFATLGYPDDAWGMAALLPEQQEDFILLDAEAFKPVAGAWGEAGATLVRLDAVADHLLEAALAAAWRKRAPAKLQG